VVAPAGTGTLILVELQLVGVPDVPLNLTVLLPCVDPKPLPLIVTEVPTAADVGERLDMLGAATTVKLLPLLADPDTVTTTLPVVAPVGTAATILVEVQPVIVVAVVPLNLTVLLPFVDPKFVPVIVTEAPTAPDVGERLEIVGAATARVESKSRLIRANEGYTLDAKGRMVVVSGPDTEAGLCNPTNLRAKQQEVRCVVGTGEQIPEKLPKTIPVAEPPQNMHWRQDQVTQPYVDSAPAVSDETAGDGCWKILYIPQRCQVCFVTDVSDQENCS
jgi:hypothetical protein